MKLTVCGSSLVLLLPFVLVRPSGAETIRMPAELGASALDTPDDATLAGNVRAAIASDESLRYELADVYVSVRDGVVTLWGTVRREVIRKRMEQVAHSVHGVARVANILFVESRG